MAFKKHLADQDSQTTGGKLSKATRHATLAHLKRFFQWLAGQPSYKSRLQYSEAEYFNLLDKDTRVATPRRQRPVPTMEQVCHVIAKMPSTTDIERRNRALVAFALMTGSRDSALASMQLKHVDLMAGSVFQDAREVKTKFSKSITTLFFEVGEDVREILDAWVNYLRQEKLCGHDDPLFPATMIELGASRHFEATGLSRKDWSTASPIREIFKRAFESACLPYFNPHSLRSTFVHLGLTRCQNPEQFKAWSQNLGHEEVLTTFISYGSVATRRQMEIIQAMGTEAPQAQGQATEVAQAVVDALRGAGMLGLKG